MSRADRHAPRPTRTPLARPSTYRATLLTLALLCGLLALLVLVIGEHTDLAAALQSARRDYTTLAPREIALLALAAAIPLAAAIAGYIAAAQSVRLLRISLYMRRLHAYTDRRLRASAALSSRGLALRIQPLNGDGDADEADHPTQRLLEAPAPVLLSGEAGSGKTTTLLTLASQLTRRRAALAVFFGRRGLPVLVPLAGYTADVFGVAGPQIAYLQEQVARFGSPGLAQRLPRLLRSGRVLLLCDSLNDAPAPAQRRILEDLAVLPPAKRGPSVILAHTGALGAGAPDYVRHEWRHWRMAPLAAEDALRFVQAALPRGSSRRTTSRLRDELLAHRLHRALRLPGLLALATRHPGKPDDAPLPFGRAALLQLALVDACAQAATDGLPADTVLQTLSALASALTHADLRAIPLPLGARLGDAVTEWLGQHRPYSPLQSVKSGPRALPADIVHACCLAGLRTGLLVITSDESGLTFAHSLLEAGCAAAWLRAADDGASPLDLGLLRSRWALPVVLWTATAADPGTITRRMLPLMAAAAAPRADGHSAPHDARRTLALATSMQQRGAHEAGAALALAGITAALAPRISALQSAAGAHGVEAQQQMARFERRLREVLDGVLELTTDGQDPAPLSDALQYVESVVGDELADDIAYLAAIPDFARLARAQLVSTLGLLASPLAMASLVEHLADKDPTLRAAVARGFGLAGGRGVTALRGQLTSANEWVRARARESLDSISAAQLANHETLGETAAMRAVSALTAADAGERAAAAETLGVLQAHDAVDALAGRLADANPQVGLAALRALGKLADPAALPVLREQVSRPDPAFRAALAETLGAYRDPLLIPDLSLLLADSDATVRAAAAAALGVMGDDRAVVPLLACIDDPDDHARAAIASALRRLGQFNEGNARRRTNAPYLSGGPFSQADAS